MQSEITPDRYYQVLRQYQSAQLLFEAIKLDVFSYLDNPTSATEIAKKTGYCEKNIELLLLALVSCGYIETQETYFHNTKEGCAYLSKASPYYLGNTILFREEMTTLFNLTDKVKYGSKNFTGTCYDFSSLAEVTVPEMYATGRVKSFIDEIQTVFTDPSSQLKILDLGGGSGVFAMEFAKHYPNSNVYVFEHPSVADTTSRIISNHNMENRVTVLSGDFNTDGIGSSYNLIIASGILDFATESLNVFMKKIAAALLNSSYLLLVGHYSETDNYPKENILSWLSGYMNGINPPPTRSQVELALTNSALKAVRTIQSGRFHGNLYKKVV
ncbi:methyltransferase [Lacrimispora sp.]|uniref:methyltransferase n=1 Tax=Lacrimispora sp. TaxID=2719234 RepID=UPI0028A77BC8|nr:methyltransferase [Lacrimispora sp.]